MRFVCQPYTKLYLFGILGNLGIRVNMLDWKTKLTNQNQPNQKWWSEIKRGSTDIGLRKT